MSFQGSSSQSSEVDYITCTWCKKEKPKFWVYNDNLYCSFDCAHNDGDRYMCRTGWCACTGYAIKSRRLREHREQMRVMDALIDAGGLGQQLEDELEEAGIRNFWLGYNPNLDGGSDANDPELQLIHENAELKREMEDQRNFVDGGEGDR